jgi:curved DNA-binding protein CbpA
MSDFKFENLKYNLYDLLNVECTSDKRTIKKAYKRLMIQYHPDKASTLEEEIFHQITLGYQILKNDKVRKSYDNWLISKTQVKSQIDLKNSYKNDKNFIKNMFPKLPQDAARNYKDQIKKLEKKHGIIEDNIPTINKYNKKKADRTNIKKIKKEKFKNNREFIDTFKNRKMKDNNKRNLIKYNGEIVSYESLESELKYTSVKDYDKLYSTKTVQTSQFSSLDRAFLMHPELLVKNKDSSKKRIKDYEKQTKDIEKIHFKIIE